ncbi:hypothetical protein ACQHIV_38485 [Kribbella sp. GL6]|uniref:hypothetical protein n=1 Tax=Kribbella sp. GL6 TaxID=3419765 RepID=UPI003D06FDC1
MAAVVIAVDQRFGGTAAAPRTHWTGVVLEESNPDYLGTAGDDGSMSVSVVNVLEPLQKARDLDRPLTGGEALAIRDAIGTLAHEAAHLVTEFGDQAAPDAYPYDSAAEVDNEGRTEYWTHDNLDRIVEDVLPDVGLEHVVPDVLAQQSMDAYPAFTSAVRDIDQALADHAGLPKEQVTQKLMLADDAQRWNVAADLVIDARLAQPGLMPEADRTEVRRQVVAPLREALSGLEVVDADDSLDHDQQSEIGAEAAQKAIAELDRAVNRVERQHRVDGAVRVRQRAWEVGGRAEGRELPPELRRLRALTGAQAGAAGATAQRRGPDGSGDGARVRGQQVDRARPAKPTPGRG